MAEVLPFSTKQRASSIVEADERARLQALDTRASCIVEAPAGSGKTGLLVQRYLKLLGDEHTERPEEVLAITFTNKATSELRERVLRQLQPYINETGRAETAFDCETRMLADAVRRRSATCGWGLLESPSRLNIRSIDSVCAQIANSVPLLAGGGLKQPVEDTAPLYRLAARRTLLQLGGKDTQLHNSIRAVLLHRDGSLNECESLIAEMLQTREQWGKLIPLAQDNDDRKLDQIVREKLEQSLESAVCAGLAQALGAVPKDLLAELTSMSAEFADYPGHQGNPSPIAICAGRHAAPEAMAEHLEHWLALIALVLTKEGTWRKRCWSKDVGFELAKPDQVRLANLVSDMRSDALREVLRAVRKLPPIKYPDEQWAIAKALFRVLRHALAELRLVFAERGECDFAELALSARAALYAEDGTSDVALASGGKLRHVLVDEMQDTSSGQYELLHLLTQSWDGRTQTLFLVGDPKQSIYLFRQARVERFLRTVHESRLGDIQLDPLQLRLNFRSQAALVGDFNRTFDLLFPRPNDPGLSNREGVDVPFVEACAVRDASGDAGIVWHPLIVSPYEQRTDGAAREARMVRRAVEQRLAVPLPEGRRSGKDAAPWRIAVLGRARAHLLAIIAEFKRDYGNGPIAFHAVDLDPLDGQAEVLDAFALTRALLHPADRIAWLAVLHAPWCGLSRADLLALTGEGEQADAGATVATLVRERRGFLSVEGQLLLDRAWSVLEIALATLGRTSLTTQVERTWRSLGGDAPMDEEQQRNVERYFDVLHQVESDGRIDLKVLSERLKTLYAEPRSGTCADGILPVDVMTIHKAKGLEWDVVLVPALQRGPGNSRRPILNWLEFDGSGPDESAGVVLAPISQKGQQSDQLSRWLADVRARREEAELKRLFYVASTRAREELHLFGAAERNDKGELTSVKRGSLLNACWPAARQHFVNAAGQIAADGLEPNKDLSEAQWQDGNGLAIAASTTTTAPDGTLQVTLRLPLSYDPSARFKLADERRLKYATTVTVHQTPMFERPEGSFAARAFGNVVHRYLESIAIRLQEDADFDSILSELSSWLPRLTASLRGEGLPPSSAIRDAARAQTALRQTLENPVGRWILASRSSAQSESALTNASMGTQTLRVDRTFIAGRAPLESGDACIWIIDFKTGEQGSRTWDNFEATEIAKYKDQMETYTALRRTMPDGHLPIRVGLFYPLVPRLIDWPTTGEDRLPSSRVAIDRAHP